MESSLVASKRNLQDASEKTMSRAEFATQSETDAKKAVSQVLRNVARELCGTLRSLSMPCLNIDSLGKTAHEIKMNLSMLEKQTCATPRTMHETVEKMPSVAQCVEVPRVELALVKHVMRRAEYSHKVMLKEISNFLLTGAEFEKRIDESFRTFLISMTTLSRNAPSDLSLCVCADHFLSAYGLKDVDTFVLLKGLNDVDGLRRVFEGIKLNSKKMCCNLKKVVYYFHEIN
ncbi:hypothetical protein ERJ75_000163800 [Trypanosoma vivax]|nr:hypothetical protein ERJ75_000163800 [Trypanosoma vivax]